MEITKEHKYSVKSVKEFQGREGMGFECTLYHDGKKLGGVTDTCDGGGMAEFRIPREAEEALDAFCKSLPKEKWSMEGASGEYEIDSTMFVGHLVDEFKLKKQLKRWCKTKVVFRVKNMKEGEYRTVSGQYDKEVKAMILKTYAGQEPEIINERFVAPVEVSEQEIAKAQTLAHKGK
jgi:hypothetical protein